MAREDVLEILLSRGIKGIILDTSFIFKLFEEPGCLENAKPILRTFKLVIPYSVYNELVSLSFRGGKGVLAGNALKHLIENYSLIIDSSYNNKPDEDIINMAVHHGYAIASQDWNIQRNARNRGLKTIYFKEGHLKIL